MTEPAQSFRVISLPYAANITARYFSCIERNFASPVLLQSDAHALPADRRGRFDILSATPLYSVSVFDERVTITGDLPAELEYLLEDAPLNVLLHLLERQPLELGDPELPFVGGYIGYFSYDFGRRLFGLTGTAPSCAELSALPLAQLAYYPWAVIVDHQRQRSSLVVSDNSAVSAETLITLLSEQLASEPQAISAPQLAFEPLISKQSYLASVNAIKEYITAGDCYQVNFAHCFTAHTTLSASELYWSLLANSPAPFAAYYPILGTEAHILSYSPERFVALSADRQLLTQPIKGTIGRGANPDDDQLRATTLKNDPKNCAENLMIVDLLRNDFGRIAATGSVKVSKLFELQSFSNVHHLVSSIEAILAEQQTQAALWRHCFPGGSITGAPKKRAMEIIDELEVAPRSIYCGSLMYASNCGNSDSNILIRSLLKQAQQLYCWGGGGIVADSDPEAEYQETLVKIQRLIGAN